MKLTTGMQAAMRLTPAKWLEWMYAQRFTGPVLVHFGNGVPREAQPLVPDLRIVFDVPSRRRDTVT